ncbi:MAG: ATP-binding protein [Clostridiaceae bacterium]
MLRVLDFNTGFWGCLRTAAESYECDKKVNAIIGQSGSGKTTLMDAIRIVLGDARFENNRTMDHYINPNSNWAIAMARFANGVDEEFPFKSSGYYEDSVTVGVRLDNSSGKTIRDYYIFDGNFTNILDLGSNPLHYKTLKIDYSNYVKILENAGISEVFKRLMMMRPEEVQNIVDLQPYQLFDKVFQLKGQKQIQEVHDDTESKVKILIEKERQTLEDLREAEQKLSEYEVKKIKYENLIDTKALHKKLDLLLRKRRYYDNEKDIENMIKEKEKSEIKLSELVEYHQDSIGNLYDLKTEKEEINSKVKNLDNKQEKQNEIVLKKSNSLAILESQFNTKNDEIMKLQSIPEESLDELRKEKKENDKYLDEIKFEIGGLDERKSDIQIKLNQIDNGSSPLPSYVKEYRKGLVQNNFNGLMIGDCISVKEEFSDWVYAIEGLLGREKFRIIVTEENYLKAKKIQEEYEYRARISLPKKLNIKLKYNFDIKYSSVLDVLDIENYDEISGYLEKYNDIFLVDTVEEGDELQKLGYKTLTKRGLLQDNDGALFLRSDYLVCGKIAREKHKEKLIDELSKLNLKINEMFETQIKLEDVINRLTERLNNQERRLKLPECIDENTKLNIEIERLKEELEQEKRNYESIKDERVKVEKVNIELAIKYTKLSSNMEVLKREIDTTESSMLGYKGELTKLNNSKEKFIAALLEVGLDKDDIEFISYEAESEKIFTKNVEFEYTQDNLEAKTIDLSQTISKLEVECIGITDGMILMVEPQKRRVEALKAESYKATEDRGEWETRLEDAKISLKYHIRETMNEYIDEFKDMAELLDAKGLGKFEQDGDDYRNWKLIIKIGFDGKEPKPYYDPDLSKGQRAAVSIMLLLAAINNKNENSRNSIMFLDEPTSRVDDYRASEIGKILQKTNIQFFITHQVSASLQSVDWINNAIILSKLKEGQEFADDPIVEYRGA